MAFEGSKIKVRRAEFHIAELEREIKGFLSKNPFRSIIEAGNDPSRQCLTFRVRKQVPEKFSAIIGDVIHNLRASLDLVASELVRLNGQSDEDVYFPFCKDAVSLEKTIKKRHLDRTAPQVVNLIRSLQPYNGGNEMLRAIHDLDIRDKHQMLIPLASSAGFGNAKFGGVTYISVSEGCTFGVSDGYSPLNFPADPKFKIGQEIKTKFILTFSPLDPLGTKEIVPTLHSQIKLVSRIIDSFEALGLTKTT